mmetsp:Transcript_21381/g.41918  ORF Transcript_21381/g.41918 Transcript_21381/m.41918 type:complete len:275 (+) Transcript_21381:414-1238(+)|eukprot:CAMPEP_0171493832 /NCGR_PEP_ID=MMETSP0958-20121227/5178_1 /TAXON_ID=87120 /ORGANISM="Aurantiochytrium limacinum, Strain ATCCMYA-1381" /LENGTH=274 /DNA_ID=CAMNT_0012027493 /DNA_START=400 /DNA_END=1224 /DNA_ORIENTATION=+
MANMAARSMSRGTSGLSEWDVVSEGALSQERYSTGSLTSDESDAVVIFGGRHAPSPRAPLRESASTLAETSNHSNALNQYFYETEDDDSKLARVGSRNLQRQHSVEGDRPWQQKHQRLLSAVSDLASDPGLNRVNAGLFGGIEQSMPIEQRLLDQIAKLAEDLDDSQEQTKLLMLQNDRLMSENDSLKHQLRIALERASSSMAQLGDRKHGDEDEESPDRMRVTLAVAAGFFIIGLAKKRLLMNSFGLLGAAIGCMGLLHFVHTGETRKRDRDL